MVNLEAHQEALYQAASEEQDAYAEYYKKAENTTGFGITRDDEVVHKLRRATFYQFLNTTKLKVMKYFIYKSCNYDIFKT